MLALSFTIIVTSERCMAQMVMSSSVSTAMTSMSCLMHTSGHMMVIFDEAVYLNNAMLIPLYLFVKVVCLNLG